LAGSTNADSRDANQLISLEIRRIIKFAPDSAWYIFGSAARTPKIAADIDILVLCKTAQTIDIIRHELRDLCMKLPLHLFLLTSEEEAELNFIETERCIKIYP
jgi:predicted nucleotidyltransferase